MFTAPTDDDIYGQEILPALTEARQLSRKWHDKIDQWRALYNLAQAAYDPEKPEYPDPTPLNVADMATGAILANDIEWSAMAFMPDPEEERKSSHIEKYLTGTLEVASEREEQHIPYEIVLNFVRDGAGVLYSVWDPVLAEKAETLITDPQTGAQIPAFTETPIRTQAIDPKKMHLLPGGPRRWAWIFREETITLYDFEQLFDIKVQKYNHMTIQQKRDHKGPLIDCWRYVDKEVPILDPQSQQQVIAGNIQQTKRKTVVQRCLLFEEMVVWKMQDMEGYDDIPYTIGFFKPVHKDNPDQWGHSIIAPMVPTIQHLERAINRRMHQIEVFTSMPMIVRSMAGRDVEIDPGLGTYEVMEPDEDITWPVWPGNPPDFEDQINFFRARLQQSGFTDLMFGSSSGDAAGYAINQLTDQNRIRLIQPLKHLEMMWSNWGRKILRITRSFSPDGAVRVYGRLRGKDFAAQILGTECADYLVRAQLKQEWPNDRVRNHAMGTQASQYLSLHTLLQTYFGIDQPDDEITRKMQEQAMLHPAMQQFLIAETLMEEAKAGNPAAALVLQQMFGGGQGGVPQPQGRPPEPNAPEQMMGLASPTGEVTPQEAGGQPPGQSAEDQMARMTEAAPGMEGQI